MITRTHTHYWDDEQLDEIRRCCAELVADALERMPHVDDDARDAMNRRISNLENAIGFMADRAT